MKIVFIEWESFGKEDVKEAFRAEKLRIGFK